MIEAPKPLRLPLGVRTFPPGQPEPARLERPIGILTQPLLGLVGANTLHDLRGRLGTQRLRQHPPKHLGFADGAVTLHPEGFVEGVDRDG